MPTRSHAKRRWLIVGFGLASALLLFALTALVPPWWAAARVLIGTIGAGAEVPPVLARPPHAVAEQAETLAGLRAVRYVPVRVQGAPHAVLLPGAHPLGIDEPRLRRMARALAAEGLIVHAVELPALRALRLDAGLPSQIADVLEATRKRAGGQRVAAFGISVTGGFLLRAAREPRAARALSSVVAIGAHHDLRSLAREFARRAGTGGRDDLDPYGARVLTAAYADALFAPEDVEPVRAVIGLHVTERYAAARAALPRLSAEGRALIAPLLSDPHRVVPLLMATLVERRGDALAALSPAGMLHELRVPVFLLHGVQDPVVPSSQTRALAAELEGTEAPTRMLITSLLRHAEGNGAPALGDALQLVDFLADTLQTAERRGAR
jgi:pimeloyl-ACP methyl ester carboxylesterase